MARKPKQIDWIKSVKIFLLSTVIAPLYTIVMNGGDVFTLDYKAVINAIVISVITYLVKNTLTESNK